MVPFFEIKFDSSIMFNPESQKSIFSAEWPTVGKLITAILFERWNISRTMGLPITNSNDARYSRIWWRFDYENERKIAKECENKWEQVKWLCYGVQGLKKFQHKYRSLQKNPEKRQMVFKLFNETLQLALGREFEKCFYYLCVPRVAKSKAHGPSTCCLQRCEWRCFFFDPPFGEISNHMSFFKSSNCFPDSSHSPA